MEIRLNKFLSEAGVCSRREADKLIDRHESDGIASCLCWEKAGKTKKRDGATCGEQTGGHRLYRGEARKE